MFNKLILGFLFIFSNILSSPGLSILTYLIFFIYFLFTFRKAKIPKIIYPLILLIPIGLLHMNAINYNIIKDLAYFLNPIVVIILGYLIFQRVDDIDSILTIAIFCSLILASYHILNFIFFDFHDARLQDIRGELTRGYFLPIIGIYLLLIYKNNKNFFLRSNFFKILFFILLFSSLLISFSRILVISLLIFYFANNNFSFLKMIKKRAFYLGFLFFLGTIFYISNFTNSDIIHEFSSKFYTMFTETTIGDYTHKSDINERWRGYETYRALITYKNGTFFEHLFGRGFGTLIDLDFKIKLGEKEFWEIPILHNGYALLLVKTGIIGLCLYIAFIYKVFIFGRNLIKLNNDTIKIIGYYFVSLSVILLTSTYVNSGIFNKTFFTSGLLLLGIFYSYCNNKNV